MRERRRERVQQITEQVDEILELAKERGYEDHEIPDKPRQCNYSRSRWANQPGHRSLKREIEDAFAAVPEVRYARRTWMWWLRWSLALLSLYVGSSFMAHAFRHPEMTDTQRFLAVDDVLLWR